MTRIPEAQDAARRFQQQVESVRSDTTLSEDGTRRKLASLHRQHEKRMTQLKAEHLSDRDGERRRLEQRAFGPHVPAWASDHEKLLATLSYRDAVLRATQLESHEQAERMMSLAMRTGDYGLARATALAAIDSGWMDVADTYATTGDDPDFGDNANAVRELANEGTGSRISLHAQFSAPLPAELQGYGTDKIDGMAEHEVA